MSSAHSLGAPHAPSIVHVLNPLIRRLLGVGLPMGPNVLLTVRGRTSGLPRTFPVAILELDGRRFIQSPFGEVNWVRNLRVAGEAVVARDGDDEAVTATELTPEAAGLIFRTGLAPFFRSRLLGVLVRRWFGVESDSTDEEFLELARRHPMFELRPRPSRRAAA